MREEKGSKSFDCKSNCFEMLNMIFHLTLFLSVSFCTGEFSPKPLDYLKNRTYHYESTEDVLTEIPSSSSLYSGTRLKATVAVFHFVWTSLLDSIVESLNRVAEAVMARSETQASYNVWYSNDKSNDLSSEKNTQTKRSVILFPGLASSGLFHNAKPPSCFPQHQLWYNLESYLEGNRCWRETMKLIYDNNTNTVRDAQTEIKIWLDGSSDSVERIGPLNLLYAIGEKETYIFKPLIDFLVEKGYEKNKTIYGVTMDWRRSVWDMKDEYYANITNILNSATKDKPAVLVCHSYGCLNLIRFLNVTEKNIINEKVFAIITLGAPWGGSFYALKSLISGDAMGIPFSFDRAFLPMQKTFTSLIHLIPGPHTLNGKPYARVKAGKDIVYYDNATATLKAFGIDEGVLRGREGIEKSIDVFDSIDNKKIKIHCLWTHSVPTLHEIRYKYPRFIRWPILIDDHNLTGWGDGTVTERSLSMCGPKTYITKQGTNSTHKNMLKDNFIFNYIYSIAELIN